MSWIKIMFAAGVVAGVASSHARADEARPPAPAAANSAVGDHEVTDAERAKLEAESEGTPAPKATPADARVPTAAVATAATTRPAIDSSHDTRQSYRPYGSTSSSDGNNSSGAMVLPTSYYALMSRSIFIKGSQEVIDRYGNNHSASNGSSERAPVNPFPTTQSFTSRPEASLIFDGVTHADGRFTALIEDSGSHAITSVSPGDRLAAGRITALTLNQLDYTAGGRTVHVGVGQNLDGMDAALGGAAAGASGGAGTPSPSSVSSSSSGTAEPAGADDVLAKLRKRRQQELTGK